MRVLCAIVAAIAAPRAAAGQEPTCGTTRPWIAVTFLGEGIAPDLRTAILR